MEKKYKYNCGFNQGCEAYSSSMVQEMEFKKRVRQMQRLREQQQKEEEEKQRKNNKTQTQAPNAFRAPNSPSRQRPSKRQRISNSSSATLEQLCDRTRTTTTPNEEQRPQQLPPLNQQDEIEKEAGKLRFNIFKLGVSLRLEDVSRLKKQSIIEAEQAIAQNQTQNEEQTTTAPKQNSPNAFGVQTQWNHTINLTSRRRVTSLLSMGK